MAMSEIVEKTPRGGQNQQVIHLPGTRMETLYTTVETGMDEYGNEYEKRQATAPRTFEKCVIDDKGVPLSKKITDILERMEQLSGGEYDTLVQEIEDVKKEITELDLGQWNYIVPNGENLEFLSDSSTTAIGIDANGGNWYLARAGHIRATMSQHGDIGFYDATMHGATIVPYSSGIFLGDNASESCYLFYGSNPEKHLYLIWIEANGNRRVIMRAEQAGPPVFPGGIKTTAIGVNKGTQDNVSGAGVHFAALKNDGEWAIMQDENYRLTFNYHTGFVWIQKGYMDAGGDLVWNGRIIAPNIASTAALMEAEQEITDQEIRMIENEQEITEMDLKIMELETKINKIIGDEIIESG